MNKRTSRKIPDAHEYSFGTFTLIIDWTSDLKEAVSSILFGEDNNEDTLISETG